MCLALGLLSSSVWNKLFLGPFNLFWIPLVNRRSEQVGRWVELLCSEITILKSSPLSDIIKIQELKKQPQPLGSQGYLMSLFENLPVFNTTIHECNSWCITENKEKQNRSALEWVLLELLGSFLLKMLQWRLNGFTVSRCFRLDSKRIVSCRRKGIIGYLSCCLCAVLADGAVK